jgi:hypothetical protein
MSFVLGFIVGLVGGWTLARSTRNTSPTPYDPYAIPFGDVPYIPMRPNGYEWTGRVVIPSGTGLELWKSGSN